MVSKLQLKGRELDGAISLLEYLQNSQVQSNVFVFLCSVLFS